MQAPLSKHYKTFFIRIAYVYLAFLITRLLFYFFNYSHFSELGFGELTKIFFFGLRFDTVSVIAINSIFILFSIIPFNYKFHKSYHSALMLVYVIFNSIGIAANLLDCGYFKFTLSRSTSDLFNVLGLGDDFSALLWQYVKDFWFLFLIWTGFIFSFYFVFKKTTIKFEKKTEINKKLLPQFFIEISLAFALIFIGIIGSRGGFQLRPIGIVTAGEYTSSKNISLVLNTPFTMLKTIGKSGLTEKKYFTDSIANTYFSPLKISSGKNLKKDNIVVIILESFSTEYIGKLNKYEGYTPFLDSLIDKSLVFTNAFANGKRSIEGIPAILAGIPSLMNEAYITSRYSGNNIESIASLLKPLGYQSSFFHGGTNGTMGFDNFVNLAGFDKYYGRTEYNNEKDFDGKWGIYDEPFMAFFCDKISQMQQPFFTSLFTLSSHHPYKVPEKYNKELKAGVLPIHQSIRYTDFALKKFFAKAAKCAWFDSTLFIITADHTSESDHPEYQTSCGMYSIPIILYKRNSDFVGVSEKIAQQTDIMPTILDYTGYNKPFISFGNNLLDSSDTKHFAVTYSTETYQIIKDNFALIFDGSKATAIYNIKSDSLMQHNILNDANKETEIIQNTLKAYIQTYNSRMIKNKMTY